MGKNTVPNLVHIVLNVALKCIAQSQKFKRPKKSVICVIFPGCKKYCLFHCKQQNAILSFYDTFFLQVLASGNLKLFGSNLYSPSRQHISLLLSYNMFRFFILTVFYIFALRVKLVAKSGDKDLPLCTYNTSKGTYVLFTLTKIDRFLSGFIPKRFFYTILS